MTTDSTRRFSDRVSDYVRWRPHYPAEIIGVLTRAGLLTPRTRIADIGSGTGISSEHFLANGNQVAAIEPNDEMRAAAESQFAGLPNFTSVKGTAEATTLPDGAADLVFCGQAFHWFDREAAKREFARILHPAAPPSGPAPARAPEWSFAATRTVLCWNNRDERDALQQDYERALRECLPDYTYVTHKYLGDAEIAAFFAPQLVQRADLTHRQTLDLAGLKGRLLSSSYCPKSGPAHDAVMRRMEELFANYQRRGSVPFAYVTDLYWGSAAGIGDSCGAAEALGSSNRPPPRPRS